MTKGMFILAPSLFGIAKAAYERTKTSCERDVHQHEPIISIVFAAAALEAFINEAAIFAAQSSIPHMAEEPSAVAKVAELAAKKNRMGIRRKFTVTREVFTGHAYEKRSQPYKDFAYLIELRNSLVHLAPLEFEVSPEHGTSGKAPGIIDWLRPKNILAEPEPGGPWILLVSTQAVAGWVCNVAAKMVQSVLGFVPHSQFKRELEHSYAEHFRLVE